MVLWVMTWEFLGVPVLRELKDGTNELDSCRVVGEESSCPRASEHSFWRRSSRLFFSQRNSMTAAAHASSLPWARLVISRGVVVKAGSKPKRRRRLQNLRHWQKPTITPLKHWNGF